MQYSFDRNKLTLRVYKSPLFIRIVLFVLSFLLAFLPVFGMVAGLASGHDFHFGYLFGIALSSLLAFFILRIGLWNSYGSETFLFSANRVEYEADYGWFKDGEKSIESIDLAAVAVPIGYEDDEMAVLCISYEKQSIRSVVKMPEYEIGEIITQLNRYLKVDESDQ